MILLPQSMSHVPHAVEPGDTTCIGGEVGMEFADILEQIITLLQHQGRTRMAP